MSVLEEFWYGNLDPAEYDANANKEYKEILQLLFTFNLAILALFLPVFHILAPSVVKWVDYPSRTRETPLWATSAKHGEQVL